MGSLAVCMRYVFILSALIIVGIFATDWWFTRKGDLLNDTLVGVMMGAPIGWFGAIVAFYTTEKISASQDPPSNEEGAVGRQAADGEGVSE